MKVFKMAGIVFLGFLAAGMGSAGELQAASRDTAPDFQVEGLTGTPITLGQYKGKVVLLDFWATWCPPCKAEIPNFVQLYNAYKAQGLEIIGLVVSDKPENVKAFVQQNGIQYPIGFSTDRVEKAYGGIRGIPTTFLVDKKGKIAQKYVGYHDKNVFEDQIRALLAE